MKKFFVVFVVLLLALSFWQYQSSRAEPIAIENINGLEGMADSTDIIDGSISGADLADTLRHTGRIYTDVLDADTLYTKGVASHELGEGLVLRDGINYLTMDGGFLDMFGRLSVISTNNYYIEWRLPGTGGTGRGTPLGMIGSGREATGAADDSTSLGIGGIGNVIVSTKDGSVKNVVFDSLGVTSIYGSLGLEKRTSMPDTASWSGGNMWLSEIGDSLYTYLTDYTVIVNSSSGAGLAALQTWAATDSMAYNAAWNLVNNALIDSTHLKDGGVSNADLRDDAVTGDKIQASAIDSTDVKDGSLSGADLIDDAITAAKIQASVVDSTHLKNDSVGNEDLVPNSISTVEIRDATIDSVDVAPGGIAKSDIETFATAMWDSAHAMATRDTTLINDLRKAAETDTTAYNLAALDYLEWDGGATNLVAGTGRTSLGLGTIAVMNVGAVTLDNNLNITDQATDNQVSITTQGAGANVSLSLDIKGTGENGYVEIINDANSGKLSLGRTTSTESSQLNITDGGADNEPGLLVLYDDGGTGHYTWMSTDNVLRGDVTVPTDDDADGYAIMDYDDGTIGSSGQPGVFNEVTVGTNTATEWIAAHASVAADSANNTFAYNEVIGTHIQHLHVPAEQVAPSPASAPAADTYGITYAYEMTVNTDIIYYNFEVPHEYHSGDISIHVHWTRADEGVGGDESGETVKWQLKNLVVNGTSENVNSGENTDAIQDVYDSSVISEQVAYTSDGITIGSGEIAIGDMIMLEIMAVTVDSGTPLTNPAFLGIGIIFTAYNVAQ